MEEAASLARVCCARRHWSTELGGCAGGLCEVLWCSGAAAVCEASVEGGLEGGGRGGRGGRGGGGTGEGMVGRSNRG